MPQPIGKTSTRKLPYRRLTPRRNRSFGQRFVSGFRAWARDTFSREQLLTSVKSLLWVAPLTVLIWIYAEREQTLGLQVQIRIEARNADPNRLVQLLDADGRPRDALLISAKISGPQSKVEQVKDKLDAGRVIQIQVDPNFGQGRSAIPTSMLSDEPLFKSNGLTVTNLLPSKIDVSIDPIEHVDVPVSVPPSVTNLDSAVFSPREVRVSGPRLALKAAREQGALVAYAQLASYGDAGMKDIPGVPVIVPALNNDPHVTISPATVSAKVTVKKSEIPGIIHSVPVWARYPPGAADKYKIDYDLNVTDVQVTGPPEIIAQINEPTFDIKPKAYFDVTPGDAGASPDGKKHEAPLRFDFGNSGVKLNPDDLQHKTIQFTLTERKPGE